MQQYIETVHQGVAMHRLRTIGLVGLDNKLQFKELYTSKVVCMTGNYLNLLDLPKLNLIYNETFSARTGMS